MSTYPGGIYSPRTKANKPGVVYDPTKTTRLYAEDVSLDDDEIVAIETELGTNPKAGYADVATYLAALTSAIGALPTTFLGLSDTPASYAGQGGKVVKVDSGEDGLEFGIGGGGGNSTPGLDLTGVSFPKVMGSNLPTGHNTLYTVPANKRALLFSYKVFNPSAGSITYYAELYVGGSYYRLEAGGTITTGAENNSVLAAPLVLEAGDVFSYNTATTAGLNVVWACIEFDDTCKLKSPRLLGVASGDQTLYTVPAGKTAMIWNNEFSVQGGLVVANGGAGINYKIHLVPSGGAPGTTNQIVKLFAGGTNSSIVKNLNCSLGAGDYFNVNVSGALASAMVWVTVVEDS